MLPYPRQTLVAPYAQEEMLLEMWWKLLNVTPQISIRDSKDLNIILTPKNLFSLPLEGRTKGERKREWKNRQEGRKRRMERGRPNDYQNRFYWEGKELIRLGVQRILAERPGNWKEICQLPWPSAYLITFTPCGQRMAFQTGFLNQRGCLNKCTH